MPAHDGTCWVGSIRSVATTTNIMIGKQRNVWFRVFEEFSLLTNDNNKKIINNFKCPDEFEHWFEMPTTIYLDFQLFNLNSEHLQSFWEIEGKGHSGTETLSPSTEFLSLLWLLLLTFKHLLSHYIHKFVLSSSLGLITWMILYCSL